ncbi:MAG: substrate-binding domain-containing protein [Deltaproteobacteria bacterium]
MVFKQSTLLILIVFVLVFSVAFILPAPASAETVLKIGGTGSALGTMKQLANEYEKAHPGIRIQIVPSLGSTGGIKAVLGGSLDIGLASRKLTNEELKQGAQEEEYARSAIVFVTNSGVNRKDVTIRELEGIFSNPAASWADGSRIRLILRPETDVDTSMVKSLSPAMEQAMNAAMARKGMIIAITDQEAAETVVRTPGAFGFITMCDIISENRAVNILSLNGVKPSAKSIADKSYPLFKSLYLVTTPKTWAEARKFAEFVLSPAAGKILAKNGNMVVKTK